MFQIEKFDDIDNIRSNITKLKSQENKSKKEIVAPIGKLLSDYKSLKRKKDNYKIFTRYHIIEIYEDSIRFYSTRFKIIIPLLLFILLFSCPEVITDLSFRFGSCSDIKIRIKRTKQIQHSLDTIASRMKKIIDKKINEIDLLEANRELFDI